MRIERSALSVPASNRRMMEKAAASDADVVFLDLEDSVAPRQKVESRDSVIWAVNELDWGDKSIGYRVNGLDTPLFYRDLIDVVERIGDRLDLIIVPKVRSGGDMYTVDTLLRQIELGTGIEQGRILLQAIIESPGGLLAAEQIGGTSSRLEALIFGPGDFSASMHMPSNSIGVPNEWDALYPGHRFHYPMSRIAAVARSFGLGTIDGPVANFRDLEAFRNSCLIARSLGYEGKWCIHPVQVPIANEVFTPTKDEVRWAQTVVDAYQEVDGAGTGSIAIEGKMIDVASVKMAKVTLQLARRELG